MSFLNRILSLPKRKAQYLLSCSNIQKPEFTRPYFLLGVHHRFFNDGKHETNQSFKDKFSLVFSISLVIGSYGLYKALNDDSETSDEAYTFSFPKISHFLRNTVQAAEAVPPSDKVSRRHMYNFIADVVEESAPAVVYIQIKNLGVRDFYTGEPMTVSNGSGFIIKEDGLILTNAHVVLNKPRSTLHVTLQDGRTFVGVVEDADMGSDLATVRIQATGLPIMKLGNSSKVRPGEFVIAMGSPLNLTNTITTGVVSSPSRNTSELRLTGKNVTEYIQTDAAITFGNSGGPLVNLDGEAIGINSMKLTPGISFAIPIDHAKLFLEKAQATPKEKKPWKTRKYLGITMVTLDSRVIEELRSRDRLPYDVTHGILVFRIIQDSPADLAGIRPGDIITHINDSPITTSQNVYDFLQRESKIYVTVIRKGRTFKLPVQLDSSN